MKKAAKAETGNLPVELKGHRYLSLDSLRGLAAVNVALSHFVILWSNADWYRLINFSPLRIICAGHEAVVLFFVLSGFVLASAFNQKQPTNFLAFLGKRFFRIYIPYFFAVLIAAAFATIFYSSHPTGNSLIDITWTVRPSIKSVVLLLLTSSSNTNQLDPSLWTLILEIRMSIIFPLLLLISQRIHPALLGALFIAPCIVLFSLSMDEAYWSALLSYTVAGLFIVGIQLEANLDRLRRLIQGMPPGSRMLFFISSLIFYEAPSAILAANADAPPIALECIRDYGIAIGACGMILSALSIRRVERVLLHPRLLMLGSRSYSIYLVHNTILFILIRCFYARGDFYLTLPLYFAIVAVCAELFNKYIDKPAILGGRHFGLLMSRRGTVGEKIRNVLKPCYVFRPNVGFKRILTALRGNQRQRQRFSTVLLPWRVRLYVDSEELVGREILKQGVFDISLTEVIFRLLRPGSIAVDVGANIGYVTGLMAARVSTSGKVVSFEPHPDIFPKLARNTAPFLQDGSNVSIHQIALGPYDGNQVLHELDSFTENQGTATMHLDPENIALSSRSIEVHMRAFDSFFPDSSVDLMKIDVEGFEMDVLAGAMEAIRARRIKHIVYEAWDGAASPVHAHLQRHGYQVFSIGYTFSGLALGDVSVPCKINRGWETPNYLATLDPSEVQSRLSGKGWHCLKRNAGNRPVLSAINLASSQS